MSFQLPETLTNLSGVIYGVVGFVAAATLMVKLSQGPNLDAIPAIGSNTWLGSWWAGFRYLTNAQDIIQEGYEKFNSTPFRVAEPHRWTVLVSSRAQVEELAKAPENELSALEAINNGIQLEHTLGPEIHHNPYHVEVLRSHLTRNLEVLYPEIRDEIVSSFADVLDLRGNGEKSDFTNVCYLVLIREPSEWKCVPAISIIEKVICRTNNRIFVGYPLCRNPDWIDLNIRCTFDVFKSGLLIARLPRFMRQLAARFTNFPQWIKRGAKLLGPVIEERQKHLSEYGTEWDDKPNDLLSWLMEDAEGLESTPKCLTTRILVVNTAANMTTSHAFTHGLFYLAANPQYIQPLREEVEGVIEKYGWSKATMSRMRKVDSFLKECQRVEGMAMVTLSRIALKEFTFSDGTVIPKGAQIGAATRSLHHDKRFYENPEVFDPFRFAQMCDEDGSGSRYQLASTTPESLFFGFGKQACPGRFLVANELKTMLAHVVMTYDVKLEDNAKRPPSWHFGSMIAANPRAKVMFRNRVD
ncbi:cytochrome P450 [Boletus edulis]|nr:cytochrome P450 [Boletus edulis]